ncbi:MAG: hypothetical protein Q4F54_04835 [Coriobacteriia bacterium]|nr:hypothetical protein [Coriobacteriia bacterium]
MSTYLEKTKGESNNRNISMCANLPAYDSADIFWTFTPNDTSLPPVTDLPTYAIPIRDDKSISDYPAGTYVRSDSSVSTLLKTITISPDDENKGNVSQDSYTFYNSSYSSANENVVEISCSNNIL